MLISHSEEEYLALQEILAKVRISQSQIVEGELPSYKGESNQDSNTYAIRAAR
jgi:hypothetical protein